MKKRLVRLKAVRELLSTKKIDSQETLLGFLQKDGFAVTQATLSRDLKMLKVGKIFDGKGGYFYSLPGEEEQQKAENAHIQDFIKGCISIDWSGNIVVIKTHSGHTDPVALALDNMGFPEVLGTIAGRDNNVAVFLREGIKGEDFMVHLRTVIPDLAAI